MQRGDAQIGEELRRSRATAKVEVGLAIAEVAAERDRDGNARAASHPER